MAGGKSVIARVWLTSSPKAVPRPLRVEGRVPDGPNSESASLLVHLEASDRLHGQCDEGILVLAWQGVSLCGDPLNLVGKEGDLCRAAVPRAEKHSLRIQHERLHLFVGLAK